MSKVIIYDHTQAKRIEIELGAGYRVLNLNEMVVILPFVGNARTYEKPRYEIDSFEVS